MEQSYTNIVPGEPMYGDKDVDEDDDYTDADEEDPESIDTEETEKHIELSITKDKANKNYVECGDLVEEDRDSVSWDDYRDYYSDEVSKLIDEIHEKKGAPFVLRPSQLISLHVLGSQKNLFMIVGTGIGKTIAYTYGIDVLRIIMGVPFGVVLVTAPLNIIQTQKLTDCPEDTVILTIAGQLKGKGNSDLELAAGLEEKIYNGGYKVIISHPESWATPTGQRILLELKRRRLAIMYAIDEFHKMLPEHWMIFRPEMADISRRLRAFLVPGAPTLMCSATTTNTDIRDTCELLGFSEPPVVISSSPIQSHFKLVTLRSPPSSTPPDGFTDVKGVYHPGFLDLFCRIYGNELVEKVRQGRIHNLRRLVMFFRTDSQLLAVFNYLREQLGVRDARTAPFVMVTSSTHGQTSLVIASRAHEIPAILTTQCLEMGMNLPNEDVVIFCRPPDTAHSVIQGMGRAGRPLPNLPGFRRKALVYVMYNSYDLNTSKNMHGVVKKICLEEARCLKKILAEYFVGGGSELKTIPLWCCSNCDKVAEVAENEQPDLLK